MATYENQKRHKVCFTKNFNFQKEYMYYIIYLFIWKHESFFLMC